MISRKGTGCWSGMYIRGCWLDNDILKNGNVPVSKVQVGMSVA